MIAKSSRIALEVVAGILAVLVLLMLVAIWRLSSGPVQLDFLTPRIEAALADPQSGRSVRIGSTQLTWAGERRSIEIHTRDVRIRDREGVTIAALPDVVIRLSLRALVQGTIAPTAVEVIGARLSLVRGPDGNFRFERELAGTDARPAEADFSRVLPTVIEDLMSKPAVDRPLTFLTTFRIVGGRVTVDDRKLQRVWEAPFADIELRRDSAGLAGDVALTIDLGETQTKVSGGFLYDRGTDRIDLSGNFTNLHTEALISLVPPLEALAGLAISLDGSLAASLAVDGAVDSLHFEVAGADGVLELPEVFAEPVALREARLIGQVSGPDRRIDLETILQLGTAARPGPRISGTATLTASADGFGGDLAVEAEATATGVSMHELGRYWPLGVKGGRRWTLRNVPRGTADEIAVRTALRIPGGRTDAIEIERLDGTLRYHDLEIHYLRPMPPITGVSGTAVFDHRSFTFSTRGGRLAGLTLGTGTIEIAGLDIAKEVVHLDLNVTGPLRASLELLDHERLKLIRRLGIDPAGTDGLMAAKVMFGFPIYVDPTFDDLDVSASVELEGAAVRDFLFGQDVTEGRLALTIDQAGMEVRGSLQLGGVPIDAVWNESFTDEAPVRTQVEARVARFEESKRSAFGLDFRPYLYGPVSADIAYAGYGSGRGTVRAAVDLENARVVLEPLIWAKPEGVPGTADLILQLVENRFSEIDRFDISAGTLRASGRGRFDDTGRELASLALDDLVFGATRLSEVTIDWLGDGAAVRVGGGVLDARPFLGRGETGDADTGELKPTEDGDEADPDPALDSTGENERPKGRAAVKRAAPAKPAVEPKPKPAPRSFVPFALSAPRLDTVTFGPDRFLETVGLELRRGRRGWQRIAVEALVPRALWSPERPSGDAGQSRRNATEWPGEDDAPIQEQSPDQDQDQGRAPAPRWLKIDFGPDGDDGYGLTIESNDMGAVLRALDIFDTIRGGRLAIVGHSDGPLPGSPLEARIEARDYVAVDAPVLARLLTVASLTGIGDLLSGQGVRFERLIGAFTLEDGTLRTDLIRAYGSSLGLTAKGEIDFDSSRVDLEGTVVPAYSVNRILGEIPVLGWLLTGGEGEGLLAVTYHMTGDLGDPEVSVNPLSVLAPGFLRGLFSVSG
ncbi:MAG: AsmA-like C-terminal domain-containing protein, partial [Proteobacteria bacterium]|nr:AsmA-like C-terminal domain-containing protein [Pseudomonadota bacterium]